MTVRHRWRGIWFGGMTFAVFCLTTLAGCGGCGEREKRNEKQGSNTDPREMAVDILSKASELTGYQVGLLQFDRHLAKHPEALDDHRLSKDDRSVLKEHFNLDETEFQEIESPTSQKLDAHYLELSYLLR